MAGRNSSLSLVRIADEAPYRFVEHRADLALISTRAEVSWEEHAGKDGLLRAAGALQVLEISNQHLSYLWILGIMSYRRVYRT